MNLLGWTLILTDGGLPEGGQGTLASDGDTSYSLPKTSPQP